MIEGGYTFTPVSNFRLICTKYLIQPILRKKNKKQKNNKTGVIRVIIYAKETFYGKARNIQFVFWWREGWVVWMRWGDF